MSRKRLSREERQKEILRAGMKVFKEKGFVYSTMEDVIGETSLSKGGVYHYYKSTTDILHDLMYFGQKYRTDTMETTFKQYSQSECLEFIADSIYEKIVDDNPYMDIYVQFLIAKEKDESLENLYQEIIRISRLEFKEKFGTMFACFEDDNKYELITNFINSMIIGAELLGGRANFKKNEQAIKDAIKILLK